MATPVRENGLGASPSLTPVAFDSAAGGGGGGGVSSRSVKRPRPVKSCTECRKRKLKCDRLLPCSQCQKSHRTCRYAAEKDTSDGSDAESERPSKRLTSRPASSTQHQQQRPGTPGSAWMSSSDPQQLLATLMEEFDSRFERLEQLVVSGSRGSTGSNNNKNDHDEAPYSARAQKPGLIRTSSSTIRSLSVKGDVKLRTRFFGQNSTRVLLNLFGEAKDFMYNKAKRASARDIFVELQRINVALQNEHRNALATITVFVDSMMPVQKRMADVLPKRFICDRLLESYISTSEHIYRIIHVPSFKREYDAYWEGRSYTADFLPRLLCMMCIGSRFETDSRGLCHDRSDGVHIPTACALVRSWLDGLRGKQLVDMSTLQAEILLLHSQRMIAPRYHNTWTQLGLIARMAMTMGLHRDPSEFPQISPFAGECRRKLWYTIVDMDLHVALACNLPSAIKENEYTCRPPRNLDDAELYPEMKELPEGYPIDHPTDSQLQVYSANTLSSRIRANDIICRLDSVRDYGEVLEAGAALERNLDDAQCLFPRNRVLGVKNKYREWRMRALLDMHVRRPLLVLYRPFALSAVNCPSHISTVYLKSSMAMLTYMDELDQNTPGYEDVNHMYHTILKHDICQAAFSICYYIKMANASEAARTTISGSSANELTLPSRTNGQQDGEMTMIWSVPGMTSAVRRTLERLVGLSRDASVDMRDIVALAVVLGSVRSASSSEQRLDQTREELVRVLALSTAVLRSLQNAAVTTPRLANISPLPPDHGNSNDWWDMSKQPLLPTEIATDGFPDEFVLWDMDIWNPGDLDNHDLAANTQSLRSST